MLFRFGSLNGMPLEATDGEAGRIKDAYFDDHRWAMRYLLVDARAGLAGGKVLISPTALKTIDWQRDLVQVDLSKQQIVASANIDTDTEPHLRSAIEVSGYRLQTSDDPTFHVEDFL